MNNRQSRTPTRVHPAQIARGPQSHVVPTAPPPPQYTAPNAALLIDFDNVTMGIRSELASELKSLLSSDVIKGKIAIRRAYADWRRYPQYVLPLTETSIDLIYAPAYGSARKNATDIRLAIDAMELVFTRPEIGTIVLLSGDSDFSSLVIKLKEYGKYIIGVGIRESSSDLLVQNCDEYYSYNALAGLVKTGDEPVEKWDPWELVSEAIVRMKRNGDVMRADRLKQVMQEIDSSFDEKNVNKSKFSLFVAEAAQRGLLHMTKLENGQLEVDLPRTGTDQVAMPASAPSVASASSAAHARTEVAQPDSEPARSTDNERPASRDRGRRGRGRDRARGERRPAHSEATEAVAAAPAQPSPPAAAPVGERLTRSEAFDLLRRSVEQLSGGDSKPLPATKVREKAHDLLGRESETLSERHFIRILHDAHDAEVIDLKRRGDDYEVSRVVPTASVAEQLNIAAAAAAPQAGTAPAPQPSGRHGARAGRAAFGKRLGEAPAHLLSIGVVHSGKKVTAPAPAVAAAVPAAAPSAAAETARVAAKRRGGGGRAVRQKASGAGGAAVATTKAPRAKTAAKKRAKKVASKKVEHPEPV